ncbi:uncharacterized protein [Dermacentor albipictus]|uniref:uncharacterized protein n=1 Tax=Dermacentor albipictus TaxID=60249 RepID=UPI0031FCCC7B
MGPHLQSARTLEPQHSRGSELVSHPRDPVRLSHSPSNHHLGPSRCEALTKEEDEAAERFGSARCNHGGGINDVRGVGVGPESEGGSKAPIIAVVVILLLLGTILIYFVISSGGTSDNVTGEGDASSGGGKGDGDGGFSDGSSGNTAYRPGPSKTTKAPPTTQPPPTTQRPPATNAVKHIKLTCTFGRSGVLKTQLPPDKMCDYIFYTHIYYDITKKMLTPLYGVMAAEVFTLALSSYRTTTFGFSFALSLMPTFSPQDKDTIEMLLKAQFGYGFKHFGALDVDVRDYAAAKSGGLQYLKLFGEVFRGRTGEHHCALGIFNASDGSSLVNAAKSATTDFPEITMLIIQVHSERSPTQDQLRTIAPNPDSAVVSKDGMVTLADVAGHLSSLESFTMRGHYLMLSLGLFARGYWTKDGEVGIAIKSVPLDYPSVCRCKAGECRRLATGDFGKVDATVLSFSQNTLVFFDGTKQINKKAKSRLDILPKNYTGIAAFNVEMDDFDGTCYVRKFPRLSAIRGRIEDAKKT